MSSFTLRFFARLREQTGTESLTIGVDEARTLDELAAYLAREYPQWQTYLSGPILMAINQTMVTGNQPIHPGDEVAWFPPVTGG